MFSKFVVLFVLGLQKCHGAIYHLNESEHSRMPPVFHLDDFALCARRGGLYCTVDFELVSDGPSELLTMIQEYSAHTPTHFNHSNLQYGICVTHTCTHIQRRNTTSDLRDTLEGCLNETLWRDYKLKTKVVQIKCKSDENFSYQIDAGDIVVGAICVILFTLNVIGSLQEFCIEKKGQGIKLLSCFSVIRNWEILVKDPNPADPVMKGLKGLYGVRTMTMMMVISCHSLLPFVISSENTLEWEQQSFIWIKYIGNGTLIVQTFFLLSGFLLAYNVQVFSQKVKLTAKMLPRKILMRWLRLAPSYLFVMAITATLIRFAESGPIWQAAMGRAVSDCRRHWWLVLLYLVNYVDDSQCMPETWYLAADMQLTVLGLVVCVLAKGRARLLVLALLFVVGMVAPPVHTYLQDLDATVLLAPEIDRNFFVKDPTFNQVYKRGHTNITCYVQGMATGILVHLWQTTGVDLKKYPKLRYIFWAIFPLGLAVVLSGSIFYADGARAPLYVRTIFAGLIKPVYGIFGLVFLVGLSFRVETVYRGILSWSVWVVPARLSYCAYILHVFLIRCFTGHMTSLIHVSLLNILLTFFCVVNASFLVALPFWLLVEAPIANVLKLIIAWLGWMPRSKEKSDGANGPNGTVVNTAAGTQVDVTIATKL